MLRGESLQWLLPKLKETGKKKECVRTGKAHPGSLPPHAPRLSLFYEAITSAISQRPHRAGAMQQPRARCWDLRPGCGAGTRAPVVPCQQPGKENKLSNLSKLSKHGWRTEGSPAPGPPRGTAGSEFGPCSLVLRPQARCSSPPRAEIPGLGSRQPPQPPGLSLAARLNN